MATPRSRAPVYSAYSGAGLAGRTPSRAQDRHDRSNRSLTPNRAALPDTSGALRSRTPPAARYERQPSRFPSSTRQPAPVRPSIAAAAAPGYAAVQSRISRVPPPAVSTSSYQLGGRQHLLSTGAPSAVPSTYARVPLKPTQPAFPSTREPPAPASIISLSSPLALPSSSHALATPQHLISSYSSGIPAPEPPSLASAARPSIPIFSSSLYSASSLRSREPLSPKPTALSSNSLHSPEGVLPSRAAEPAARRPDLDRDRDGGPAVERKALRASPAAALPPPYGTPGRGLVGLSNLGNTCFMNAAVQCLAFSVPLASYFLRGDHARDLNRTSPARGSLAQAFAELLEKMWGGSAYSSVAPRALKETIARHAPRFAGYNQHDSHELVRFLLDGLHEDVNRASPPPRGAPPLPPSPEGEADEAKAARHWSRYAARNESAVIELFSGQIRSRIECGTCGHVSTCFDPFLDLSVPIPKDLEERSSLRHAAPAKSCSLADCFRAFTERETLSGDEAYRCGRCRAPRTAYKSLALHRLPPLLVVHLKRFTYSGMLREKLHTDVAFPLAALDLSRFTSPGEGAPLYDLYAVCCHQGSLSGGHYYAHCLHPEENKWYTLNDSSVEGVGPASIRGPSAYLLFFQRRRPS